MNESLSEIVTIIDLEKGKWKVTVERALEKKKNYEDLCGIR